MTLPPPRTLACLGPLEMELGGGWILTPAPVRLTCPHLERTSTGLCSDFAFPRESPAGGRRAHRAGPPQVMCTSPPGRVSVDPFPDENGRPSTRLLASRPAVRPRGRKLTDTRTVFPHLWATSSRKPRVSVAPGRGVTRERVKTSRAVFGGEVGQGALAPVLPRDGALLPQGRCVGAPPPRRSSPSKTKVAAEGPPHLPQPGEHVPTSAARGQPPAATLDFRGDRPEGRAERGPLLPRKVARVPQQGGASLPSLQLPLSLLWPSGVSLGPSQLRDRGRPRHLERREGRRSVPLPGPGGGSAIRRTAEAWEPPRRDARRPVELPHREALGDRLWGGRTSVTPRIPDRSSRGIPLRTRESVPHATVVHWRRSAEVTRSHERPNPRVAEIPQ